MPSKKSYYQIEQKEKLTSSGFSNCLSWFVFFTCASLSLFLVCLNSSNISTVFSLHNFSESLLNPFNVTVLQYAENLDECAGKYIYIQQLPARFNEDLLANCSTLNKWLNMCDYLTNSGLGPRMNETSWYETNQFSLEAIFHSRMKQYKCLTNQSSKASAIYVPFYAGLDVGRHLWDSDTKLRDEDSVKLVEFLKQQPEWERIWGHDHFLVAGRVSWDFRRQSDKACDWGNCFFYLPEVKNMTSLVIESSPWNNTDFAIPYPTYFHPSSDNEVYAWQERMRSHDRPYLFSFAGAPRPQLQDSVRKEIISQCINSKEWCKFLRCDPNVKNCDHPVELMRLFQDSVFCLQPPGDSFTRRSAFDAILAGCIPVFFHPASAYVQYLWHLPKNFTEYSVFIPIESVKNRSSSIERRLLGIPKEQVLAMREKLIGLIPNVVYANPTSRLGNLEDAFDVTIREVLNRVEMIRGHMNGENNSTTEDFPEEYTWKYSFFGGLENHEWDGYFVRS